MSLRKKTKIGLIQIHNWFQAYEDVENYVKVSSSDDLKENEFKSLYKDTNDGTIEFVKETQIDTDFEILFPDDYINSIKERLNLYNELSSIKNEEALELYEQNLIDRFGESFLFG